MEIIEAIGWVLAGFIPTLAGLEIGYRKRAKIVGGFPESKKEELVASV